MPGGSIRSAPCAGSDPLRPAPTIEAEQGGVSISSSESGTGFGIFGGVDIPLTTLLSLPLEANYMYAKPSDDVSGFGFSVALAFNWGAFQ